MPARAWRRKGHRHRHVVYAVIELDVDSRAPQVILGDGAQLEAEAAKTEAEADFARVKDVQTRLERDRPLLSGHAPLEV